MKALEIGDIVETVDGVKMVVNIFRNLSAKEVCCQCVDVDDDPIAGDRMPVRKSYTRSQVNPVDCPSRYGF